MTTYTFVPRGSGTSFNWDDPTIWSTGTVPSGSDADVVLPAYYYAGTTNLVPYAISVRSGTNFTVRTLSDNSLVALGGNLAVLAGVDLLPNSTVSLAGGTLSFGGLRLNAQTYGAGQVSPGPLSGGGSLSGVGDSYNVSLTIPDFVSTGTLYSSRVNERGSFTNSGTLRQTTVNTGSGHFENTGAQYGGTVNVGSGGSFTNAGSLNDYGTLTVNAPAGGFTNFASGTLTGGTYQANGADIDLNVGGLLVTDAAAITLLNNSLPGSSSSGDVYSFDPASGGYVPLEQSLRTIAATGSLDIAGRFYSTSSLTVAGTLTLTSTVFNYAAGPISPRFSSSSGLTLAAGGRLVADVGSASIDGSITGPGIIEIAGYRPTFTSVPYTSTLEVAGAVSSTVLFDDRTGVLQIDAPQSFTGSITPSLAQPTYQLYTGTPANDQIQLVGLGAGQITSSYQGNGNGGTLTITDNGVQTALKFNGAFNKASFALTGSTQPNSNTPMLTITVGPGGPDPTTESYFGTVVTDPQSPGGQIYALYDGLLGRTPDAPGFSSWQTQLTHGESLGDIASSFLNSAEFSSGLGYPVSAVSDQTFVDHLYQVALGRPADGNGEAYWDGVLAAGTSRADVAVDFATGAENENQIAPALQAGVFEADPTDAALARLYYGVFDRSPDGPGLLSAEHQVQGGTSLEGIAGQFLGSPEYAGQHPTVPDNATYVSQLYVNTLGRAATDAGAQGWVTDLANGSLSRAAVTVAVATSAEAQTHLFPLVEGGTLLLS